MLLKHSYHPLLSTLAILVVGGILANHLQFSTVPQAALVYIPIQLKDGEYLIGGVAKDQIEKLKSQYPEYQFSSDTAVILRMVDGQAQAAVLVYRSRK